MNSKSQIAASKFQDGYNCAQSVLHAVANKEMVNEDILLKVATGFGGGMARQQEVCGALTGGIMALGLKYGRGADESPEKTRNTYEKTQGLFSEFKEHFSAVTCRDLLHGIDLRTEEGQKFFKENDLSEKICTECVKFVADYCSSI